LPSAVADVLSRHRKPAVKRALPAAVDRLYIVLRAEPTDWCNPLKGGAFGQRGPLLAQAWWVIDYVTNVIGEGK
jgi:hypothetical protein